MLNSSLANLNGGGEGRFKRQFGFGQAAFRVEGEKWHWKAMNNLILNNFRGEKWIEDMDFAKIG
jgi:hypothetical protein